MAILRRTDSVDPVGPYIMYFWSKKWWLLLPAIIAFALTYVALRFVPEEFKVKSEIYVNRFGTGQEGTEAPNPASVAKLLESTMVFSQVRDEYVKTFSVAPTPIERFVKQFKVITEILQDTSVRKEISPVIAIEVQSVGSSETRFLMDSWIRVFIQNFGSYSLVEAVQKRDALKAQDDQLTQDLARVGEEVARYGAELRLLEKLLAEKLELLSPADLNKAPNPGVTMDFNLSVERKRPGLLERLAELKITIETDPASSAVPMLKAETAAIKAVVDEVTTAIAESQKALAATQGKQTRADRELRLLNDFQGQLRTSLNRLTIASSFSGLAAGSDVRALSTVVMPELRVWPKRTMAAGVVAAAVMIIAALALLISRYLSGLRYPAPPRPESEVQL